ncbi:MAG TPA: hypothetical protein VLG50_01365 [Candidatus Saccharimonadales bacterium]|nr:hypothetical protein [Candidatus Saccharimonadales bacterium]
MKNKTLLFLAACINLGIIFLLIHKQNKIIKLLYEHQQLIEQKEYLLQQKKLLMLEFHKGQQLSSVQTFAKNNLHMNPIKLKDAKTVHVTDASAKSQAQREEKNTSSFAMHAKATSSMSTQAASDCVSHSHRQQLEGWDDHANPDNTGIQEKITDSL